MECGVSEDAVSGHIQYIEPGRTACYECLPPLSIAADIDERTLRREGVCAASLPTTMGIIAGLLTQNTLKLLLHFGDVSAYLGYSSTSDHFDRRCLLPNSVCDGCRKWQEAYKRKEREPRQLHHAKPSATTEVVHTSNEWSIEVVDSSDALHDEIAHSFARNAGARHLDFCLAQKVFTGVPALR